LPLDQTIGAVYVGATYAYTSSQLSVFNYNNPLTVQLMGGNFGTLPSRSLLNLDAGWTSIFGSGVDLSAFGTNVTNKKYYQYIPGLGVSVLSGGNEVNLGMELANVGEPRMYGVRLRYRFGQ
jgi:iron complex outermembrane receptor protein